jgi:hypothetical protein
MLIEVGDVREVGSEESRLSFSTPTRITSEGGPRFNNRRMLLDGTDAFELSFWTGTCEFLFERKPGACETLSLAVVQDRLNVGLERIDSDVLDAFGALLPRAEYQPMLFDIQPRLIRPGDPGDYFGEEQQRTWGLDSFWGLPQYPRTPYYRSYQARVLDGTTTRHGPADGHLYEFEVPMVPPSWNDASRVGHYRESLATSSKPTVVALSLLDICQPATLQRSESDYYAHWGLAHFLLDGHHKMQAAAELGSSLRLLSIVSVNDSVAKRADVLRLSSLRAQTESTRT